MACSDFPLGDQGCKDRVCQGHVDKHSGWASGTTKQALIDQLDDLGRKYGEPVDLEGTVAQLRERIAVFKESQPVAPVTRVTEEDPDGEQVTRPAQKSDLIAQLLDLNPDAKIWDHMIEQHLANNEGKNLISVKADYRIRLAARMIEANPHIGPAFKGGHSEVTIIYFCPTTGIPMKARSDYLKMRDDLEQAAEAHRAMEDRARGARRSEVTQPSFFFL